MIYKNNLSRIKGILSAKKSAEIPKFLNPAGPLRRSWYMTKEGKFYLDGKEVSQEVFMSDPRVNDPKVTPSDWLLDESTIDFLNQSDSIDYTINNNDRAKIYGLEIPGELKYTPTTAIENSANTMREALTKANEVNSNVLAMNSVQLGLPASPSGNSSQSLNKPLKPLLQSLEDLKKSTMNIVNTASVDMNTDLEAKAKAMVLALEQKKQKELDDKATLIGLVGAQAFTTVGDALGAAQSANDSELTLGITTGYKAVQNAVSNLGPIGLAVSGIMGIASATGDILQSMGGSTDQQSTLDKWMDSPLLSWNIGAINGFFGKNTDSFVIDSDAVESVGSSYGGTVSDLNDAVKKANKKYGLFSSKSRKKANNAIAKAKIDLTLMADIGNIAEDQRSAVQSMGELAGLAYSMMTSGGYDLKYTYAAKQGGILEWTPVEQLEWRPLVELNWVLPEFKEGGNIEINKELVWIPEFKKGGKALETDIPETEETNQKNVIPEGALHKNKHHMEHAEGLTKKGIPVIDEDGEQQAEIEHSEIIFTLEVTKKLEEYYEIFYSDESSNKEKELAALEAGKLLVYLILENTEDRTGLIDSCKKGGSLTLKKSTDDLIEEVLDLAPTLMIVELVIEETLEDDKPKKEKPKEKSEKEQMKEAIKEVLIELLTK